MYTWLESDRNKINSFLSKWQVNSRQDYVTISVDMEKLRQKNADENFEMKKSMEVFEDISKTKKWVNRQIEEAKASLIE